MVAKRGSECKVYSCSKGERMEIYVLFSIEKLVVVLGNGK